MEFVTGPLQARVTCALTSVCGWVLHKGLRAALSTKMAHHLRIHLLGDLELWRDGRIVPPDAWPSRKACLLFELLVTHRSRTVASDELIEWLWPNLRPASARNSLWVAVSHMRRLLEPARGGRGASTFVLTEPAGYRFDAGERCEIDVEGFLGADKEGTTEVAEDEVPVAVLGIVPVKVTDENGPVQPGDLLTTSSAAGHAMRCDGLALCFGRTLGKALEGLPAGQHTGVIQVLVSLQ